MQVQRGQDNPTAFVHFKPSVSGVHCFELINVSDSPAFVSLVILRKKTNANFILNPITEALQNILGISKHLATMLPPNSEIPANRWTLFGGNINQGSSVGFYNVRLARGAYVLIGTGENSVNDCDVEVIEQNAVNDNNGKIISKNTDSMHPFDFAVFVPNPSNYHFLKLINKSSKNASAFMFGFLILVKK